MASFGSIFFANMGCGGGQSCFQNVAKALPFCFFCRFPPPSGLDGVLSVPGKTYSLVGRAVVLERATRVEIIWAKAEKVKNNLLPWRCTTPKSLQRVSGTVQKDSSDTSRRLFDNIVSEILRSNLVIRLSQRRPSP